MIDIRKTGALKSLDDDALIRLSLIKGNQAAFSELISRHQSKLRYSLRQLTAWNEALADDLAQESFIQAYQSLHTFAGKAQFSSWLYKIAYRCFLQHLRKHKESEDDIDEHPNNEALSLYQNSQQTSDLHQQLAKALASFEPERRSVLHLFLHRQCTHNEIANIMGIPLGSVKTHITRGRKELQSRLKNWQPAASQ